MNIILEITGKCPERIYPTDYIGWVILLFFFGVGLAFAVHILIEEHKEKKVNE